jgi:hypothetical protein
MLKESCFRKIIFLLICAAFMVTSIGSAAALSSADQTQTAEVSVTNGEVSYTLDQQQSAQIITGDGIISQDQQSSETVFVNPYSALEIVTVRASEVQSVDTPFTDDINNKNSGAGSTSNVVETINTEDDGKIELSQEQTEQSEGDIYQEQDAFLKIISTPQDKVIAIVHLKNK